MRNLNLERLLQFRDRYWPVGVAVAVVGLIILAIGEGWEWWHLSSTKNGWVPMILLVGLAFFSWPPQRMEEKRHKERMLHKLLCAYIQENRSRLAKAELLDECETLCNVLVLANIEEKDGSRGDHVHLDWLATKLQDRNPAIPGENRDGAAVLQ